VWSLRGQTTTGGLDEDGQLSSPEGEPQLLCQAVHAGDVTDMTFTTPEHILASSSNGSLTAYRYNPRTQTLSASYSWSNLHHHTQPGLTGQCACTGVTSRGEEAVVTVGEDGSITLLNMDQRQPVRVIERADSCSLHAVTFLKHSEAATVNAIGQLKVWDMRQAGNEPARILHLAGERTPLYCVDKHPTQPHIVATGGREGTLCVWDMRQDKYPVTLLSAHNATMWELQFHPLYADHLFTCSDDGSVWHWDGSSINAASTISTQFQGKGVNSSLSSNYASGSLSSSRLSTSTTSPWLASEAAKHRLDVTDMLPGNTMPVNSIDIDGTVLLAGTDAEQIYTIKNVHCN